MNFLSNLSTLSNLLPSNTINSLTDSDYRTTALEFEIMLLERYSGLKNNLDLFINDIEIDYLGKNYIHTITAGDPSNPTIVLLHGYMSGGASFYRMIGNLAKFYWVKCIDTLGTGLSSRPKFDLKSTEDVIGFFVESIEKWRQAEQLDKMHLGGHSIGGYIAGKYAVKYPQYVEKLSLISPAGVTKVGEGISGGVSIAPEGLWTPQTIVKKLGGLAGTGALNGIVGSMYGLPEEDADLVVGYWFNMLNMEASSDVGIHYLLKSPVEAYRPLEEELGGLEMRVDFYFGVKDWMDSKGARRLVGKDKGKFRVEVVPEAGHNLLFENPVVLCELIVGNSI